MRVRNFVFLAVVLCLNVFFGGCDSAKSITGPTPTPVGVLIPASVTLGEGESVIIVYEGTETVPGSFGWTVLDPSKGGLVSLLPINDPFSLEVRILAVHRPGARLSVELSSDTTVYGRSEIILR